MDPCAHNVRQTYCSKCIASDYELWGEFVDPSGIDSREEFEQRGFEGNMEFMRQCGFLSDGSS